MAKETETYKEREEFSKEFEDFPIENKTLTNFLLWKILKRFENIPL